MTQELLLATHMHRFPQPTRNPTPHCNDELACVIRFHQVKYSTAPASDPSHTGPCLTPPCLTPRPCTPHPLALQVKLLKCLVDNIVVDISFFQIGGLNTYQFLEDVDCYVDKCIQGRRHLFKDSIILVGPHKAT